MSKPIQPIPPGHENLIPHLVCSPCSAAIEFYKKAFGAEEVHRIPAPDGRRIMHAAIRIGKSFVFLVDDFPEFCGGKSSTPTALKGTPVTIHHYVDNCDASIKRAQDAVYLDSSEMTLEQVVDRLAEIVRQHQSS